MILSKICEISFIDYRKLHIWNREAVLQYTGEQINGLEHPISWKPSGSLIAGSQMLPNKHLIVFIEKNGLKHGEFELPFPPMTFKLELILWSNDSQILLILGTKTEQQDTHQILMLWRQTNYKWDLKQTLPFEQNCVKNAIWDPIDPTLLHIMLSSGHYMRYRWKWSVDESEGIVGVVDGKQLKLTNLEQCVIPPPFFSYSLNFESEIRQICLSKNNLSVILSNESLYLFQKSGEIAKSVSNGFSVIFENFNEEKEVLFQCFYSNKCQNISRLTNVVVDESGRLFGEDSKHLFCFDFKNESQKVTEMFDIKFKVLAISCLEDTLAIVADDGQLWKVDLNNKCLNEWTDRYEKPVSFPQQCSRLQLFKIKDRISTFCLTENFTLSSDNEILSQNNCNSFIIFNRFLLFTTTDHLMHCWLIDDNIFDTNNNYQNFKPRNVERGSKIITAARDGKIVLQMPRGNLEAVYPRPLLLDLITSKLNELEFDSAFDLLRRHRINLNILYDYNPKIFIDNIELFIEKIANKSIDWICLFLNDLSNNDFYAKMTQTNRHKFIKIWSKKVSESTEKIDLICDLMRETMNGMDSHKFLNPILLTYLKKSGPEIANALKRIKSIDDSSIRDKSIKFLLYSIDINTLVDEALGSYDCDVFLMIASKSQKDPKEYLALLEKLNQIESFDYKCYKIDIHLKRYKKALKHISKCDQHFEECLQLIRNHSLYRDSVVLFENSSEEKKKKVWKLYAEYLFDKRYFEESAIAFKRSGDLINAIKAYQLCDNWSAAVECAVQCPHLINIEILARNLSKHLVSIGKHFEASYLLQTYANDYNQSIITLIDGHEWEHALRLMAADKSAPLLEYLKKQLLTHFESIESLIAKKFDILLKYMNRLEIVRQKQSEKSNEIKSFDNFDDKSDIYSETNSWTESKAGSNKSNSSSLMTKKSRKSVKKSEKRKFILKEGSNDEDIQLIYAIKEVILTTDQMQEEVSLLVKTLFHFDYLNESKKIQNEFNKTLELIKEIIEEIWSQNQKEESAPKYVITGNSLLKIFKYSFNFLDFFRPGTDKSS